MRIQHNIMAMSAYRNYTNNVSAMKKNLEKLSSGYKINRAGDDAAGLAISEKMRAQITGLETAQKNAKDGISLVQTAEGALTEVHDMLNRMVELATQSANGTYDNTTDRNQMQKEIEQLQSEINRIADSSNFNGIKLLDGSLDSDSIAAASSSISNITSSDYSAKGASPAFEATYVTNRPAAATQQTNAKFSVSLDDLGFTGAVKAGDTFTLKVGDTTISYTVAADGDADTAAKLATKLSQCGKAMNAGNAVYTGGAAPSDADAAKNTTAKWNELTGAAAASTNGANATDKYIKINDHWYEMGTATGAGGTASELTFTQVDYMGKSGETIDPNFAVDVSYTSVADTKMTGTVNDHVQKTTSGVGIGSSHQAQVDVAIDFSKIKDGDKLTVGEMTYVFKIGKDSTASATGTDKTIDLSKILKEEADLSDEAKLNRAMTLITQAIDGTVTDPDKGTTTNVTNSTWTSGNFGVNGTVGTISFQSKSDYTDDAKKIGGNGTAGTGLDDIQKANMTTEASVMRQFYSERGETNASTSFDVDATKIKNGDQFTVNGIKFEFWSEGNLTDETATKIDLSSLGDIKNGSLLASQTSDVVDAIKTTVSAALGSDFTVSTDGGTVKIESKDKSGTGIKENKIAAEVKISGSGIGGGLKLQIGDTADEYNQLKVNVKDMHASSIGIGNISVADQDSAAEAVDKIKAAINYVSDVRGTLGATQNRLDHTINNLSVMQENIQDAESTIRDTDVAAEMMEYTKNNILIQSAQAMLAQANQVPQGVLQLLG